MSRPLLVLLVEDSEDDAFFFRWALKKSGVACQLTHVSSGAAAIDYIKGVAAGTQARPAIVFLDLKLPTFSGFDILAWLQDHGLSPRLRVVVLSGSEHAGDIARAESLGAAGYFVKPISEGQLRTELESVLSASTAAASP